MLTGLDLANLCADCYWEHKQFDRIIDADGVFAGVKHYSDCSAIAFRGSTTIQDWLRDFQGVMIDDPQLGGVEQGFRRGVRDILIDAQAEIQSASPKIYITGHSLGAARALVFAGLLAATGFAKFILNVTVFGSPRPGGQKLKDLLMPVFIQSYKNGDDPVTDVPFNIPFIAPYIAPRDLLPVDILPATDDPWGPLARHHIQYYQKAMEILYAKSDTRA